MSERGKLERKDAEAAAYVERAERDEPVRLALAEEQRDEKIDAERTTRSPEGPRARRPSSASKHGVLRKIAEHAITE